MSKSKPEVFYNSKFKYFTCHKTSHFKKDFLERGINSDYVQIIVSSYEDHYEIVCALVVTSLETHKSWVMDSDCSYHMCLRKEYFLTLDLREGGVV